MVFLLLGIIYVPPNISRQLIFGAISTAYDMQIDGKRGAGRPKQTWKKLTEKDCCEWKLTTVDPQERSTWRSGVRSALRAASQLPGKGPTDVDDAPAPAR